MISIHALREEGDPTPPRKSLVVSYFNPRPPRGGRLADSKHYKRSAEFQSTPSARRATFFVVIAVEKTADFNPRPPRGGRLVLGAVHAAATGRISIHALREEGDSSSALYTPLQRVEFQSTPSARRATAGHGAGQNGPNHFNPRPPRGGRPWWCHQCRRLHPNFNPRPPRGGRHLFLEVVQQRFAISIHALREEGDGHPTGGGGHRRKISIHALREEGDSKSGEKIHHVCSIIHTCAQFEKELYEGSGEMQNKSC